MTTLTIQVDRDRLQADLERLSQFSDSPHPSVTRVVFTEPDMAARAFVKGLLAEAGLATRQDAIGNVFARWQGSDPSLPPVATGSHIDAVPDGGRFDGTAGTLGAVEAVRALKRAGFAPRRSIELIVFTSEEPTRFGVGCLGSRAMSGALAAEQLRSLRDRSGQALEDVLRNAGYSAALEDVRIGPGAYSGFLELHIEQGPALEAAGIPVGVVSAIAGPAALRLVVIGTSGHAGAVPMGKRHDALLAAAEIALAVEQAAIGSSSPYAVATTGALGVHPGTVNVIPGRAELDVDVRDVDAQSRDRMIEAIQAAAAESASRRGVAVSLEIVNADPPTATDPDLVRLIEESAQGLNLASMPLVSRAYHDALFMALLCPVGMIFIPSRGGVSHSPQEYSFPEAIAEGTRVLAAVLARLAS